MLDLTQNRFLRCRLSYFAFPTFLTFLPTIHFCNSVFLAFTQFLMGIYHFLIELQVNNLRRITVHLVILSDALYESSYDLALLNICSFHLMRIFLGNYLPSRFYFFFQIYSFHAVKDLLKLCLHLLPIFLERLYQS